MASYVRTNRLGTKSYPVELTIASGGSVDVMAHFDATAFALRFTYAEAIELAMLLLKHADGKLQEVA